MTKIVKVIPPKPRTAHVGRHRAPASGLDDAGRAARKLVGGTLGDAGKISGRLTGTVTTVSTAPDRLPGIDGVQLPDVQLPDVQLPDVQLPDVQLIDPLTGALSGSWPGPLAGLLPDLGLPSTNLPGIPVLPGTGPLPGGIVRPGLLPLTDAVPATTQHHLGTLQGPAGTASSHLSWVALPDAPSAPAAPRGPRPTGPVPAQPAGTGAGAAVDLGTLWAETAPATRLTPSGPGTLALDRKGPAPRDLAGMSLITPD